MPTFHEDGSGKVIPLRGGAKLQVVVRTPAHDEDFEPTYSPANRTELVGTSSYRTLRQVAWGGSWEGQTTIGVGTRARPQPQRVDVGEPADGAGQVDVRPALVERSVQTLQMLGRDRVIGVEEQKQLPRRILDPAVAGA